MRRLLASKSKIELLHLLRDLYVLHTDKKLRIARRHDRQLVTGLVVNQKVNLPRRTRRRPSQTR